MLLSGLAGNCLAPAPGDTWRCLTRTPGFSGVVWTLTFLVAPAWVGMVTGGLAAFYMRRPIASGLSSGLLVGGVAFMLLLLAGLIWFSNGLTPGYLVPWAVAMGGAVAATVGICWRLPRNTE